MEEQGAQARAGQDVLFLCLFILFLFLAEWGEEDQGALIGSTMPVWGGIRSCTKSPPPLLWRRSTRVACSGITNTR